LSAGVRGDANSGRRITSNWKKLAYTIEQAAEAAGVGRSTIYEEIRDKRLTARKLRRRTIITGDDLLTWLQSLPKVTGEDV
jgi:excisionase family DNA binding protein